MPAVALISCCATSECFGHRRPEAQETGICRPTSPEYRRAFISKEKLSIEPYFLISRRPAGVQV
jgi:hypothetical protein